MNKRDDKYLLEIGTRTRAARKKRKLSLQTICDRSGLAMSVVYEFELGRKNVRFCTVKFIADAIGVEMKDLV